MPANGREKDNPDDSELIRHAEAYHEQVGFPGHYIDVGGQRCHYLVAGNGPAVVLLHGLGGSCGNWVHVMGALAKDHRVYAPDLLGFGLSEKPKEPITLAEFAAFLEGFVEAHTISRTVLVGNSMGGLISLMYTMAHSERVSKLVLVDSAGIGKEIKLPLRVSAAVAPLGWRIDRSAVRRIISTVVTDMARMDDDAVEYYYNLNRLDGSREAFVATVRLGISMMNGQKFQVTEMLPLITQPTLILWGSSDRILPVAHARLAHRLIPGSQLHILEKAGHCPQMERPDEWSDVVLRFLAGTTDHGPRSLDHGPQPVVQGAQLVAGSAKSLLLEAQPPAKGRRSKRTAAPVTNGE